MRSWCRGPARCKTDLRTASRNSARLSSDTRRTRKRRGRHVPLRIAGYTNFTDIGDDNYEFHLGQKRNTSLYNEAKGNSAGNSYSTAEDLLRFSLALRGHKLLTAKSLDLMTTEKYFFRKYAAGDIYYGYGFELENIN